MKLISNPKPPHECKLPGTLNAANAIFGVTLLKGAVVECDECGVRWEFVDEVRDRGVFEIVWDRAR